MAKIIDDVKYDLSTLPSGSTASNGNLTLNVYGNAKYGTIKATKARKRGIWYWEVTCDDYNHSEYYIFTMGIVDKNEISTGTYPTLSKTTTKIIVGDKIAFNTVRIDENVEGTRNTFSTGVNANLTKGSTIGLLMNLEKGTLTFYKNGIKIGEVFRNLLKDTEYVPAILNNTGTTTYYAKTTTNFGATDFKYIPNDLPVGTRAYEGWLMNEHVTIKNPTTNKEYSLKDNTLIHIPNQIGEDKSLYGIESGKELRLDTPFTKQVYFNNSPTPNNSGKVFIQDIGAINVLNVKEITKELKVIETWYETGMTSNNTPSPFVASASSEYVSTVTYNAFKAFDNKFESEPTDYQSIWSSVSGQHINSWIMLDLGESKDINCVRLTSRFRYMEQTPTSFYIEGSTDNQNWSNLGNFAKNTWTSTESAFFDLKRGNYRYLKITHLSIGGATAGNYCASWSDIKYGLKEVK